MKSLNEIVSDLHDINFGNEGIIHPVAGGKGYNFDSFLSKGRHEYKNSDGCACQQCDVICDLRKTSSGNARFTYVAHGTHMVDFLAAHGRAPSDLIGWSTKPIIFLLENPSNDSGNAYYTNYEKQGQQRFPSEDWFWLDSNGYRGCRNFEFPNYFTGGEYGKMFYSIMRTFHIANGYVTDSVKCGIGEKDNINKVTSTSDYDDKIIKKCIEIHLSQEIKKLRLHDNQPVIIFAFGENAYKNALNYLKDDNVFLFQLPHPANHQISDDYRKYVLFGKIAKVLLQSDFYAGVEPVNILSILKNDKFDSIPELSLKEDDIVHALKNCAEANGMEIECKNGYRRGKLTYCIEKLNQSLVRQVIFRYKPKESKQNYKSFWARYNFAEGYIDFWRGREENKADEYVEDKDECRKFFLYEFVESVIQQLIKN